MSIDRRYDIDWMRVIAIGLLLLYHVAIGFQPWGIMIGFIANKEPWVPLWVPMAMLNIWRIPLLFFISGMGVYFAMQNRSWKELISERASRILFPFIAGIFLIVPIHILIWRNYYKFETSYDYGPAHLWFLGNIFAYVVILSPLFFLLKKNTSGRAARLVRNAFSSPLILIFIIGTFIAEALIVKPNPYELYAVTWHGFYLGLLAFVFGYCFVFSGKGFLDMLMKWRWIVLATAVGLFAIRLVYFKLAGSTYLLVTESDCWIFSVLAFGYRYLNRPGPALRYLSKAAYPVYIIHMVFLFAGSWLIFPLEIDVRIKFILLLMFTLIGCLGFYEFVIRRVKFLKPLFGLKMNEQTK